MNAKDNSKTSTSDTLKKAYVAGKIVLSLVIPPLGFATLARKEDRVAAAIVGCGIATGASIFFGIAKLNYSAQQEQEHIANAPSVSVEFNRELGLSSTLFCISPIGYFTLPSEETRVYLDGRQKYFVEGDDVVVFDKNTHKYKLNFDETKEFGEFVAIKDANSLLTAVFGDDYRLNFEPISETSKQYSGKISELEQEVIRQSSEGDIWGAKEYSKSLVNERERYSKANLTYIRVKEAFSDAVDKMNLQLEEINTQTQN